MNEDKRTPFQDSSRNEKLKSLNDGKNIYAMMRKKYSTDTKEGLNNILKGIISSLILMMLAHVEKDNHRKFIKLIYQILNQNL